MVSADLAIANIDSANQHFINISLMRCYYFGNPKEDLNSTNQHSVKHLLLNSIARFARTVASLNCKEFRIAQSRSSLRSISFRSIASLTCNKCRFAQVDARFARNFASLNCYEFRFAQSRSSLRSISINFASLRSTLASLGNLLRSMASLALLGLSLRSIAMNFASLNRVARFARNFASLNCYDFRFAQ